MDIQTKIKSNHGNYQERFGAIWDSQIAKIQEKFSSAIEEVWMPQTHKTDVPVLFIRPDEIVSVLRYLKDDSDTAYEFLSDITASDEAPNEKQFEVIYQLFSHKTGARIRVKVRLKEDQEVESAVSVWPGANWAEREVFDMYGVRFKNHPDLRRILMDHRWEGYPLRKDYPLRGYQIFPTPEKIDPKLLD